jgi:hypothetical protein
MHLLEFCRGSIVPKDIAKGTGTKDKQLTKQGKVLLSSSAEPYRKRPKKKKDLRILA